MIQTLSKQHHPARRWLAIVAIAAWLCAVAICTVGAVVGAELRPFDRGYDNGAALSDSLRTATDTVHVPGGVYYHSNPVVLDRDSLCVTGQGVARWRRVGAFAGTAAGGATSAAIFVYLGPPETPAWIVSGDGVSMRGINIWRDFYGVPPSGIGLELRDWGKRHIEHCSFAGWDKAMHLAASNHNDESTFASNHCFGCRSCLYGDEPQSSGLAFRGLFVHGPAPDGEEWTVFDLAKGGNYSVDTLCVNERRLLLRLRHVSSNTCSYTISNVKIDNNAAGWRLVQMDKPGPLNLTVRGHVGQHATPGPRPIVIPDAATPRFTPPPNYQHLDVELWGGIWRPNVEDWR